MTNDLVIDIVNLSKRYGEFVALDNLTLSVSRGQILGLIGPNGAGKTTTIKILVGLSKPTSGHARIAGRDCTNDTRSIKKLVGFMPDRFGSYENMRVHEYLDFFGAAFGIPLSRRRERIKEVLEITDAVYMQDRYVESLSHGMQQRVGIARTLLHNPEVLIFDEPANGLDPKARVEMRELLLKLASMGKTLIVTSHILPELARICNRIAILSGGRLQASGSMAEIMKIVTNMRLVELQLVSLENLNAARSIIAKYADPQAELEVSETERLIRFRTTRAEEEWSLLARDLVNEGVRFSQLREIQTDLEDAYLSVTETGATADAKRSVSHG